VRWRKRGVWVSVGVGRRVWIWIGGRWVVDEDDDDDDDDDDDGVDVALDIAFYFGSEWVRYCRLVLVVVMAVYVCA
jgi:hypothetical protein